MVPSVPQLNVLFTPRIARFGEYMQSHSAYEVSISCHSLGIAYFKRKGSDIHALSNDHQPCGTLSTCNRLEENMPGNGRSTKYKISWNDFSKAHLGSKSQ
jgi:hypothetical protein